MEISYSEPFQKRDEPYEFRRLSAVRNCDDNISFRNHAQVAMARLGRMQEKSRRAGRSKRCSYLLSHQAGLAHARYNDPSLARIDSIYSLFEIAVELFDQTKDSFRFRL
jgi:hypothetical protein